MGSVVLLPCPYLGGTVELTDERRQHILSKHPEVLPEHLDFLARTIADPDQVRSDSRFPSTRLFSRWFDALKGGKFLIVAVVSDQAPAVRHWIVTAYVTRGALRGVIEWTRN
jgi:hypothetical protein